MVTLRIRCPCGQTYSFPIEPVNQRMPGEVKCPACGLDGTEAANASLGQMASTAPSVSPAHAPPTAQQMSLGVEPPLSGRGRGEWTRVLPNVWVPAAGPADQPQLRPDWGRVMRNVPDLWLVPLIFVLIAGAGAWLVSPWMLCLLLGCLKSAWDDRRRFTLLLKLGEVCPAVVVADPPGRVVVLTNLNATGGDCPAVRVFKEALPRLAGGPHRPGARLVAVAYYLGPTDADGNWQYFTPELVNKFVSDPGEIARVFNFIPAAEWQRLEAVAATFASHPDGVYAVDGGPMSARGIFTTGQRRALWAAGIMLAAIAIGVASVFITARQEPARSRPFPSAQDARGRFPAVGNPARPNRGGIGSFSVGDPVEVLDLGRWRAAKVTEADDARFRFKVRFTDGGAEQWVHRGQMRSAP